jgi:hypothetical protein
MALRRERRGERRRLPRAPAATPVPRELLEPLGGVHRIPRLSYEEARVIYEQAGSSVVEAAEASGVSSDVFSRWLAVPQTPTDPGEPERVILPQEAARGVRSLGIARAADEIGVRPETMLRWARAGGYSLSQREAAEWVDRTGSPTLAAEALGVSITIVRKALRGASE